MRLLILKFYFDNPDRNQANQLAAFEVKDEEAAARILLQFENNGATIRAAFLVPNIASMSKTRSFRFEYKETPFYKYVKGSY